MPLTPAAIGEIKINEAMRQQRKQLFWWMNVNEWRKTMRQLVAAIAAALIPFIHSLHSFDEINYTPHATRCLNWLFKFLSLRALAAFNPFK